MNVRLRLILGSLLVALFVLFLFGTFAYRITLNSIIEEKQQILHNMSLFYAEHLNSMGDVTTAHPSKPDTNNTDSQSIIAIISDNKGNSIPSSSEKDLASEHTTNLQDIISSSLIKGQLTHQNEQYIWSKTALSQERNLVLLLSIGKAQSALAAELIKKLIIIGLIAIWLAIWIALIIAKRIVVHIEKQAETLMHQALHDHLTELPNRSHLFHWLESNIEDRPATHFHLAVLDLNNFKEINDTLGHHAGDEILLMVCKRLQSLEQHTAFVARLGGDSFAIVFHHRKDSAPEQVFALIHGTFDKPFSLYGLDIMLSGSIGLTSYPDASPIPAQLIKQAEVAMYQAKQAHSLNAIYNEETDPYNLRRLALTHDLNKAIEENQLMLYYQPKVDSHRFHTVSVEALVRWQHPEHGFIPPIEFVPLAEKSLLIDKLTLWVLETAICQTREWLDQGLDITVAINISAHNLKDTGLAKQIEKILHQYQVPAKQIKLEITESAMMADPELAMNNLHALHDMGLQLSIDDFGTGYSSLSYLKKLPVTELKIDRSFVKDMTIDENDRTIVYSTIELAHNMGCTVVAEGVEDKETLQLLQENNCDLIQGYYFSRPKPSEEITQWILDHNKQNNSANG